MLATSMATKKPTAKKKPEGRKKSLLTLAGEAAQRGLLLQTLKEQDWNLTTTAEALKLTSAADVLRAIKSLGLTEEYDAAKEAGKISPGTRRTQ